MMMMTMMMMMVTGGTHRRPVEVSMNSSPVRIQCETNAKPVRNPSAKPSSYNKLHRSRAQGRAQSRGDTFYFLIYCRRAQLCCNLEYEKGFALGFRIGFALDPHCAGQPAAAARKCCTWWHT